MSGNESDENPLSIITSQGLNLCDLCVNPTCSGDRLCEKKIDYIKARPRKKFE